MKKALIALLFGLLTIPALADNSIVENLQELIETRDAITNAIVQKGGTVTSGALTNVPNEILSIPSGGGDNGKFVSLVERTISGEITAQDLQGVTTIGRDGFSRCPITSIELPDTVTTIGQSAFYQSTNLTSITIPNSVTSIGQGAFNGCTGLTSLDIPDSVTYIATEAFRNCSNLYTVDFGSTRSDIPVLGGGTAFASLKPGFRILVPAALLTTWKSESGWSSFASHIYPHIDFDPYKTYVLDAQRRIEVQESIVGNLDDEKIDEWSDGGMIQADGTETIVIGLAVTSITAEAVEPSFFPHLEFLDRTLDDISGWTGYPWGFVTNSTLFFLDSSVDHTIK